MSFQRRFFDAGGFLDKTGIAVSWACAAHCAAMPLLVSGLPLLGIGFLAHEATEYVFIGLSLTAALLSLLPGFFKYHRNFNTLLLFAAGIGLVVVSDPLFEENPAARLIFVICGAAFISAAHFFNRRLCRSCRNCAEAVYRS